VSHGLEEGRTGRSRLNSRIPGLLHCARRPLRSASLDTSSVPEPVLAGRLAHSSSPMARQWLANSSMPFGERLAHRPPCLQSSGSLRFGPACPTTRTDNPQIGNPNLWSTRAGCGYGHLTSDVSRNVVAADLRHLAAFRIQRGSERGGSRLCPQSALSLGLTAQP
jgi:hypothetical protein